VGDLGLGQAVARLGERVVADVTDAADRGLLADLGKRLGVADRQVSGGLNRSSRRFDDEGYDDGAETRFQEGAVP
jgi:hypothetical protein